MMTLARSLVRFSAFDVDRFLGQRYAGRGTVQGILRVYSLGGGHTCIEAANQATESEVEIDVPDRHRARLATALRERGRLLDLAAGAIAEVRPSDEREDGMTIVIDDGTDEGIIAELTEDEAEYLADILDSHA